MEPVTVTVNDACKLLGLGRSKLYELIGAGDLETAKLGGRTLVLVASIKALVSRSVTARAA